MGDDVMDALCPSLVDGVVAIHTDQIGYSISCVLWVC